MKNDIGIAIVAIRDCLNPINSAVIRNTKITEVIPFRARDE
jgi:hypothetical protein